MSKLFKITMISEKDEYIVVDAEGKKYRFKYDYEMSGDNWDVEGWDDECEDFSASWDCVDAEYGRIEDAVRSHFGLDFYHVYEDEITGHEPAITVQAGSYHEAYNKVLQQLGYQHIVRGGTEASFEYERCQD
jgi:hypothetical protein